MAALHPSNPYYNLSHRLDQQSATILQPYESQPHPQRSTSIASIPPSDLPKPKDRPRHPKPDTYRTRSIGGPFCSAVYFEREYDLSPPNDDEIIIATVRVTNPFRRASIQEGSPLPSRPPARNFLRRLSSRIGSSVDQDKYTAMKMPRRDYKMYFARDREGKYAGTEPEREWSMQQLEEAFGEFQDMPLRSIPGANEYGEGDRRMSGSGTGEEDEEASRSKSIW